VSRRWPTPARPKNVLVGAMVSLDGRAGSDADGDPLTYAWTLTTRPAGSAAVLSGATTVNPSFVAMLRRSVAGKVRPAIRGDPCINVQPAASSFADARCGAS